MVRPPEQSPLRSIHAPEQSPKRPPKTFFRIPAHDVPEPKEVAEMRTAPLPSLLRCMDEKIRMLESLLHQSKYNPSRISHYATYEAQLALSQARCLQSSIPSEAEDNGGGEGLRRVLIIDSLILLDTAIRPFAGKQEAKKGY